MKKISINDIINSVFENGFIDDHENGNAVYKPSVVIMQTRWDKVSICWGAEQGETSYFSLNPFYLDEETGMAHLDTCSCGGVIDLRGRSLDAAVVKYNNEHAYKQYGTTFDHIMIIRRADWEERKAKEAEIQAKIAA